MGLDEAEADCSVVWALMKLTVLFCSVGLDEADCSVVWALMKLTVLFCSVGLDEADCLFREMYFEALKDHRI